MKKIEGPDTALKYQQLSLINISGLGIHLSQPPANSVSAVQAVLLQCFVCQKSEALDDY